MDRAWGEPARTAAESAAAHFPYGQEWQRGIENRASA
jgi:hypothetical protein